MLDVSSKNGDRISLVLLLLRLSVFLVLLMWVLDKFVNPAHASKVFEFFYGVGGLGTALVYGLGVLQLIIIVAFVIGFQKIYLCGGAGDARGIDAHILSAVS